MGSTFTAWVVMVAAMVACAAFGLALGLPRAAPACGAPPHTARRRRVAGGRQRLEGPAQKVRQALAPQLAPKLLGNLENNERRAQRFLS